VSEFVEECRREWRRLGVPDAVANEMAADLTADLQEAEAEGASAEEVLGSGAFDPRAFAASWAAERGVIQAPAMPVAVRGDRSPRRPLGVAALALVVVVGAVLVLSVHRSGVARQVVASPFGRALVIPGGPAGLRLRVNPSQPFAGAMAVDINSPDDYLRGIGLIVLVLGVAGFMVAMLYWWQWPRAGVWSRRQL
jgi:hypothetical protein